MSSGPSLRSAGMTLEGRQSKQQCEATWNLLLSEGSPVTRRAVSRLFSAQSWKGRKEEVRPVGKITSADLRLAPEPTTSAMGLLRVSGHQCPVPGVSHGWVHGAAVDVLAAVLAVWSRPLLHRCRLATQTSVSHFPALHLPNRGD